MKFAILGFVLSLLAFSAQVHGAAVAIETQSTIFNVGTALKTYYKAFQSIMPCGYAPVSIPVLAPYTLNNINLNFSNDYYSIKGNISDLYITGLDKFEFLKWDYDADTGVISFDVFHPQIQVLAESELDLWVMVGGYKVKQSGKKLWDLKYESLRSTGQVTIAPNAQGDMRLSNNNIQVYLGDVQVYNWYDQWNGATNNFNNEWIRHLILFMSQESQGVFNDIYSSFVVPYINQLWANVNEQQFIDFLVTASAEWSMSNCRA